MKVYNTLSRQKEEFVPLNGNIVTMYSCGPTVYNFIHIGNARPLVAFDTIARYLAYKGYDVRRVQNFTDVDDKIINKALEEGVASTVISERFIQEALTDENGLNVHPPEHRPKVTEEMDGIIAMIDGLVQNGFAYEKNGTVYFDTARFEGYGKLSKKNIEELEAGSRVAMDTEKTNVSDFVLWKPAKPGEPKWPSPWGDGRPGWHIECSAMIKAYLGETIDIHTGGEDLIFPHHENEIAQSECANGAPLAKYWLHNGFLNVDNKKMSKSLGNFFTVREILEKFDYDVIRFFLVSAHYRMPVNFSDELLQAAENGLNRIKNAVQAVKHLTTITTDAPMTPEETQLLEEAQGFITAFEASMDDDFNTADGVSSLFELVRFANIHVTEKSTRPFAAAILEKLMLLCGILGLKMEAEQKADDAQAAAIEAKIQQRQDARKAKDFKTADAIRDELAQMGVVLEDTSAGVRWSYKK